MGTIEGTIIGGAVIWGIQEGHQAPRAIVGDP